MVLTIFILLVTTILAGLSYFKFRFEKRYFKQPLVFAGAYLFSITVIHILPELFSQSKAPHKMGLVLLIGFFLQHILEYFTSGVEHGHVHNPDHKHRHSEGSTYGLLIALCIHALLEGALLSHPSSSHARHESHTILFGIIIHKMPAAFALMTVMACHFHQKNVPIFFLIIFSVMSPIGLLLSDSINFAGESFGYLFALVSGSFLHISTTIFVESNPGHKTDFKKIAFLILGILAAVLVEMV